MSQSARDIQFRELKDTVQQLNTTIRSLNTLIENQNAMLAAAKEREEKQAENNKILQEEIAYLKSKLFGASSEKRKNDQIPGQMILPIFNEAEALVDQAAKEDVVVKSHIRKKRLRNEEKFKDLPTEDVIHDVPEEERICPACGSEMVPVGKDYIRTEVQYVPAKLKVIRHYQMVYECRNCRKNGISNHVKAGLPKPLIDHSFASPSLVAWVMYQKYANAVPLYRQEKDWHQIGLDLDRTTMARWMISCSQNYFRPIYDFFHRKLLERHFLMADETRIQVLKEPDRRPQTYSFMWLYRTGEDGGPPIVLYGYTETRAGQNAKEFLEGYKGYLETDGYQGYNKVNAVVRCACWAHTRRYFYDAIPKGQEDDLTLPAVQAVVYIDRLFNAEKKINAKIGNDFEKRKELRIRYKEPEMLGDFFAWLKKLTFVPNSRLAKAVNYTLKREELLQNYLKDGRCSFSNNLSENMIRPFTVGRKNWLFSDTPGGAEASAIVYTMAVMAQGYHLNVNRYFAYLLAKQPSADWTDEQLDAVAPWSDEAREVCSL